MCVYSGHSHHPNKIHMVHTTKNTSQKRKKTLANRRATLPPYHTIPYHTLPYTEYTSTLAHPTMVRLQVFLIRHGETFTEIPGEEPNLEELPHLSELFQPSRGLLEELSRLLDPALTFEGYIQSETALRAMAQAFRQQGVTRNLALFSSPLQSCTCSAAMIASAGFEPQEWSEWIMTTRETAMAPTAIPIIVSNGLADCTPEIRKCGGYQVVLDAGLLACTAAFWNKKYKKDPIMGIVRKAKDEIQDHVKEWVAEGRTASTPEDTHLCADTQFLKFGEDGSGTDPYGLMPMSLKFNFVTDLLKPNKIMEPHRKGCFESNIPPLPPSVAKSSLERCIGLARQAGCDTVIAFVSKELIASVMNDWDATPGATASLTVDVNDDGTVTGWNVYSTAECGFFDAGNVPPHEGTIEPSVPPPPGHLEVLQGAEKWGAFPPPMPEKIPKNYPKDIPPFGQALSLTEPDNKPWAWVHMPGDNADGLSTASFHAKSYHRGRG